VLVGGAGSDTLDGGAGDDVLVGGHVDEGGTVTVDTDTGAVMFTDTDGIVNENDPAGDDVIFGGSGADVINDGAGYDTVDAGTGDDTVFLTNSDATIDGGAGTDTLVVAGAAADADLIINLENASVTSADGSVTVQYLAGFENIVSGDGDDVIIGSELDNVITGGMGDDTIIGGSGDDTAVFRSSFSIDGTSETTVTFDPEAGTITVEGPDGTDTVSGVENLAFDGLNVSVIDAPTLEDTAFDLDASGSFEDLLSEGAVSITISGVPDGAELLDSAGNPVDAVIEGNTWTLRAETETTVDPETGEETVTVITPLEDVLAGLTIRPDEHSDDDFTLWIGGQNANGGSVGEASMVNMVVTGVADMPNLEVGDVYGVEDEFIALDISAGLVDTDTSETLSINISGIPQGTGFNTDGTYSELRAELPNGDPITFALDPNSDNYTIEGYTPTEMESILQSLEIKPPFNHDEDFDLTFAVTATEADGDSATATSISTVNVMPLADQPNLALRVQEQQEGTPILADGQIIQVDNQEDVAIPLNILPESMDPSEILSLSVSGIPDGAVFEYGIDVAGQTIYVQLPVIDGTVSVPIPNPDVPGGPIPEIATRVTPPHNSNVDFQLTVTATSTEPEAEYRLEPMGAFEDFGNTVESVTISGFPPGTEFSEGTDNGDGTWTLQGYTETVVDPVSGEEITLTKTLAEVLEDVTVTPPLEATGDMSLQIAALDDTGATIADNDITFPVEVDGVSVSSLSGVLNIELTGDADPVDIEINDVTGDEDTAIPLDITANLTDTDGSETLSITISGVPDGAELTSQSPTGEPITLDVVDGSVTLTEQMIADGILDNLQVTPPGDSNVNFELTVTATVTEAANGDTATNTQFIQVEVANDPDLFVHDAEGFEDTPLPLNMNAFLDDSDAIGDGETLSITISNIPDGATLTTTDSEGAIVPLDIGDDGLITLTDDQLPGLHIQAPPDSNEDFVLSVTATSTTDFGDIAETTLDLPVQITGIADDPDLDLGTGEVVGEPETAIPLTINTNLNDLDGSETLTVSISNLPTDAVLSVDGVPLEPVDGVYTLGPDNLADQLAGLTVTPPPGSEESFTLLVTATASDFEPGAEGGALSDTATVGGVLNVVLDEGADPPIVNLGDAQGYEDTAIALNIDAQLQDLEETLTITISDVPSGATLSAGNLNPDGSYTLTQEQLANLTITPPADSNVDFDLTVAVTSIDGDSEATVTETLHVDVIGVADAPNLATEDATGQEDTFIPLDVSSSLNDTDDSETLTITIGNVPEGAVLSILGGGPLTPDPVDGTYTLTTDQLDGLGITPPPGSDADFTLDVTATTVEDDGDTATVNGLINVDVQGVADVPDLNIGDAQGLEDTAIPLNIDAQLADADEVLSVTITRIPTDAVLMSGSTVIPVNNGMATLTQEQLADLTITPPPDSNVDMDLKVTATATQGGSTAQTTEHDLHVDVIGVADAPNLATEDSTGDENQGIPLDISTNLTDTDGSESLSITIGNIPDGATLNKGTLNADGTYTLTPAQLFGLEVTPATDFEGTFTLFVTSTSTENDGDQANTFDVLNVNVEGGADTPALIIGDSSGLEDSAIALNIDAQLTDLSETLSVTISGVPDGAALSNGTIIDTDPVTGETTWNVMPAHLNTLSITPPEDSNVDFNLTVTAASTNGNGDIAETEGTVYVAVQSVADEPELETENATGTGGEVIDLEITSALTDLDGSESLSLTISGVPQGASLSAGVYTGNGTWALEPGDLNGLTISTPENYDTDFDLTVTATATDSEPVGEVPYTDTASVTATIHVDMEDAQADPPVLVVDDAEGLEDNAIPLDITASLTDPEETLSMTISGVPQGASLSLGTDQGEGVWSFTEADLANIENLTITPPLHSDVDFDLTVTATSQDGDDTATVSDTLTVVVGAVADTPAVSADDGSGDVGQTIPLDISSALVDQDGSESLSITISDVPAGASLSAGTDNQDGTWTLELADLTGLNINLPADASDDFDLTVTATATEADGGDTASSVVTSVINVDPNANDDVNEADMGGFTSGNVITGLGDIVDPNAAADTGSTTGNTITEVTFGDTTVSFSDPSAVQTDENGNFVTIEGDFGTLKMYEDGDYGYVADPSQAGESGSVGLTDPASPDEVEAAWSGIETFAFDFGTSYLDNNGQLDPNLADDTVSFNQNGIGVEGTQGGMPVPGQINHDENTGQSEALGVNLGMMAATATVQVSNMYQSEDGGEQGVWQAFDADGNLVGEGVLDDTTVDFGSSSNVGTAEISLPDGAQFQYLVFTATDTGGDTNPNDSSDFYIRSIEFETPGVVEGEDLFGYTMADADGDTASATLTINVENNDVTAEPPVLVVDDVQGLEDTAIALDISAALTDTDGSETLSVTISDVPDGVTLSAGTLNPDGSYTLTPDQLDGLTVTPPLHSNVDFDLTISATSVESASADTNTVTETMTVDVVGVADEPPLTAELGDGSYEPGDPQVLTVEVTNVGNASAGYNNTYGYYIKGENGEPVEGGIVWSNVKTTVGDSETITLEGVDPASVGFFLIPDGYDHNPGMTDGMPVTFQQDDAGIWTPVAPDGTLMAGQGAPAFFSDEALNPDDYDHMVDNDVIGNQNWEDLFGGGDNDYNDANLNATMETSGGTPGNTTFPLDIATSLVDADGSETLSFTVAGLPEGVTLSAGTDNGNGSYTLTTDQLDDLSMNVPEGVDGGFDFSVTSTTTEDDGDTASVSTTLNVPEIDLVAETPELVVENVTGDEDTAIALDISAALTDTDGSETLSVTISDVPDGVTLSAGTLNDDGSYTLLPEQLDGLTATPPADSNVDFDLTISATSIEQSSGDTNTVTQTMTVDVIGVADEPTLDVALGDPTTSGGNPQPVAYWNMNESSDQGTLADSVGGHTAETHCGLDMDDAGVFGTTAAEFNGSNDYISVPHSDDIKPDSGAITVWFNADTVSGRGTLVSSDSSGFDTGGHFGLFVENGHLRLRMQGTDDQTNITGGDVSTGEWNQVTVTWGDDGAQVYLNGEQVASDSSWTRGLEGNDNPWTFGTNQWVSGDDVANNLRDYFNGHMDDIAIFDTQLSADDVSSLYSAGVTEIMAGGEGGDLVYPLDITSNLTDTDGSETLSLTVNGLPEGATLSAGTVNDDGSVTLSPDELQGLELTVPGGSTDGFDLTVSSTATENDGDTATVSQTVTAGALDGTAETPELDVDNATGAEDTAIALNIDAALTDTDGSETLSVTISGVPTGAQLSAGTDNQDGTWTLESGDLNGLTITPPANSNEDIALSVTATSTESSTGDTATATANLTVDVIGVADQPQVVVQDEQGNEDTRIQLHLDSGPSVDTDGSETLSITISDVPQGARLNPGADNGDGTWTVTAAQLPLVCILPPDDFSGDITMTLNVTTTENDGDTTTVSDDFTVSVIGVADGPSVTATQAQGYEDSAIALNIGASLTDDDNSETLSVTISGIPQGATLSAGTVNNDGSVTLTPQQLDGLTITPPEHSNEDFPLTVSATSTETATGDTATTMATFNVGVTGVADTPSLSVTVGQPTLESGGAGSEFIVNGSFESVANQLDSDDADNFATLEGWQTTDESFEIHGVDYNYRDASSQSDGDFKLELDGGKDDYGNDTGLGSNSNIFQDVQGLAEGATYTLSFDSDNREGDADGYFEVFWGGEKIATITDNTAGFISHEFELVGGAGDGSDRLEFNLIGENEWAVYLDNVSLEGTENTLTYPLDIASGLVDTDGSETLSVTGGVVVCRYGQRRRLGDPERCRVAGAFGPCAGKPGRRF